MIPVSNQCGKARNVQGARRYGGIIGAFALGFVSWWYWWYQIYWDSGLATPIGLFVSFYVVAALGICSSHRPAFLGGCAGLGFGVANILAAILSITSLNLIPFLVLQWLFFGGFVWVGAGLGAFMRKRSERTERRRRASGAITPAPTQDPVRGDPGEGRRR